MLITPEPFALNAAAKIRWLLALICLSLFLTAIIARKSYSPRNNLENSAKTLETNLHAKEREAHALIDNNNTFSKLKSVEHNEQYSLELIDLLKDKNLYISTYHNNQLVYWNSIRVLPDRVSLVHNGTSFLKEGNGYYEAIKKTEGEFSVVIFIPVKNAYNYTNQYLQNTFAPDLLRDNNIDIADVGDKTPFYIHTYKSQYLFSVKLKADDLNHLFTYLLIMLWFSGMLLLCVLTNNLANYIASKGFVWLSFATISIFIIILRFVNLHFHWPDIYQNISLFNGKFYSSNQIFPSLGDLVINVLLITWLALFIYNSRNHVSKPIKDQQVSYAVLVSILFFLIGLSTLLLNLFSSLVLQSTINFDVNNVLNLTPFSIIGVGLFCFGFFIFILLAETCLVISSNLNLTNRQKLTTFLGFFVAATIIHAIRNDISAFYLLMGLIVLIRGYAAIFDKGKFTPFIYIAIIIICATVASVKLYYYQSIKEMDTRKGLVLKLESADDPHAEAIFTEIEGGIANSIYLSAYFKDAKRDQSNIKTWFQNNYFDGYLSKYDFWVYEYDQHNRPFPDNYSLELANFVDDVEFHAYKVKQTRYFYKTGIPFGFQNYFAIIPINTNTENNGTLVLQLKSKPLITAEPFPELLIEGKTQSDEEFKDYSFAFYDDGKLQNQSGKYIYSLTNADFVTKNIKRDTFINTTINDVNYSNLVYRPNARELIVVTKEDNKLYTVVTSLTFFFMVFMLFVFVVLATEWVYKNHKLFDRIKAIRWNFWDSFDKVLYKTRIQLSMVFAVVITLFIIGVLTFISVSSQYQNQQDDFIHDKISRIAMAYQKAKLNKTGANINADTGSDFNAFADIYSSDLTLFDKSGSKILTTQPKIYQQKLVASRMNAKAFVFLNRLQKAGFINEETIGDLKYKAAYAPVRDIKTEDVIGYLQLPYFSNESEYRARIGAFLNTMINVYALVFIAIGLFAIVVARQITTPLTIIQQSLSKTIYGRKNEPIIWQHNDEIGSLIKEYNNMIAALENSATKLAQSERENAWREMAKQVAHEIKNPLTPLKLGLQLLEKSWKDKDPKFDLKFERFSKSFVEQIDSLSKIASEFSNFAKMPDTQIERFDVFEVINQAVNIFKQTDNVKIFYHPPVDKFEISADKDQILRSFNNLLKNAIEAVPPDREGIIEITYETDSKHIYIKIKDNGSGIPDALRDRIFVPNFTTKSSGTGLGLALVKNAIEHAKGSISFETKINVGTTFYVNFPVSTV
jgi:two-component system nitrogen regulation sensor histidine kinase NtrY